jgi:hypothetical protein
VKRFLIAAAAYAALMACSSSTNVCQQTLTSLDVGDCNIPVDSGILLDLTIDQSQRAACEVACTSSSDQTAVTNLITCLNYLPADAGTCSLDAGQNQWLTHVAGQALACSEANMPSSTCYNAVTGMADAG